MNAFPVLRFSSRWSRLVPAGLVSLAAASLASAAPSSPSALGLVLGAVSGKQMLGAVGGAVLAFVMLGGLMSLAGARKERDEEERQSKFMWGLVSLVAPILVFAIAEWAGYGTSLFKATDIALPF